MMIKKNYVIKKKKIYIYRASVCIALKSKSYVTRFPNRIPVTLQRSYSKHGSYGKAEDSASRVCAHVGTTCSVDTPQLSRCSIFS